MKKTKPFLFFIIIAISLFVTGCSGLSRTYAGNENSFFEKMNFTSGNKVEIYFMGASKEGSYEKDGTKVKISVSGETQLFTLTEKGCLDGGSQLGTYCKQ